MGVYDFFKGTCPKCNKQVDDHPEYGRCGDIQTKYFIVDIENSFRDFKPGCKVPFAPNENFIIGRTCCCDTLIKAIFDQDLLIRYDIASIEERREYAMFEKTRGLSFLIPKEDLALIE